MSDPIKLISAGSVRLISAQSAPLGPVHKRGTLTGIDVVGITKFVSSGKRMVRGMASTDAVDRQGEIVDPRGGTWKLPLPLLWNHRHDTPVGWVRSVELRGNGLWIEAEFAEGIGRSDEIWSMVDRGLVSAYSIGFRPIATEPIRGGGVRHTSWELLEVSAVVIPANPDAKIQRSASAVRLIKTGRQDAPVRLIRSGQVQVPIRLITSR